MFGLTIPATREGNVSVTGSIVILHGLNRTIADRVISLDSISEVHLSQVPRMGLPAEMTIILNNGERITRRSQGGRRKVNERFLAQAFRPVMAAMAARA